MNRPNKKSKIQKKVITWVACLLLIVVAPMFLVLAILGSITPAVSGSALEGYKEAANAVGTSWQDLLAYDTVRFENELEDVDPFVSATEFLKVEYREYEEEQTENGITRTLVLSKSFELLKDILDYFGIPDGSTIQVIKLAIESHAPSRPEYQKEIIFLAKDLDDLIGEWNEEQIEWLDYLLTSGFLEAIFGDDLGIPSYIYSEEGGYFAWPTPESHVVGDRYNPYRMNPVLGIIRAHEGQDIPAPIGSPVISVEAGIVTYIDYNGGERGINLKVRHEIGDDVWESRYQHLSSIEVSVGDRVERGTLIARTGNTGIGTGPHLHFELRFNGVILDPLPYITGGE